MNPSSPMRCTELAGGGQEAEDQNANEKTLNVARNKALKESKAEQAHRLPTPSALARCFQWQGCTSPLAPQVLVPRLQVTGAPLVPQAQPGSHWWCFLAAQKPTQAPWGHSCPEQHRTLSCAHLDTQKLPNRTPEEASLLFF